MISPKWIGSMPSLRIIGSRIGTRMVIAAMCREAADESREVREEKEDPLVLGQAEDEVGERLRRLGGGQEPGEDRRGGDDEEHRGGGLDGVEASPWRGS